ncbi:MAG: hypothetical protein MRY83_15970 [Flavobacteriales bacterium]|nr:hypothetical protein [Flavobacteriales bacterium]
MPKKYLSFLLLPFMLGCNGKSQSDEKRPVEQIWMLKYVSMDHMIQRQEGIDSLKASITDLKELSEAIVNYKYPKPKNEDYFDRNWNFYLLQFEFDKAILKPAGKQPINLDFEFQTGTYHVFNDSIDLKEVERTDTSLIMVSSENQDNLKWLYFEPIETRNACHSFEISSLLKTFSWHTSFFEEKGSGGTKVSDFDAEILEYSDQSYTHLGLDSGLIVEEFKDIWKIDCYKGLTMLLHGRAGKINSFILIPEYIGEEQIDGRFIGEFDLLEIPGTLKKHFTFIMQPIKDG